MLRIPRAVSGNVATNGSSTTTMTRVGNGTICERGLTPDRIDYWRDFLRVIDRLTELGCTRDSSPRLGDLVYCMLFLIELGATEQCGSNESCCRKRLSGNLVLRDFFLLSVRDFVSKHLETLAALTTPDARRKVFAAKAWFSCRVHSDVRLLEAAAASINLTATDVDLADSLNGRVCFFDQDAPPRSFGTGASGSGGCASGATNSATGVNTANYANSDTKLIGIDTFSPTLALYTFSNLRDVYATTAFNDTERFTDEDNSRVAFAVGLGPSDGKSGSGGAINPFSATALVSVGPTNRGASASSTANPSSRKRKRVGTTRIVSPLANLTVVGRPPSKKSWFQLCTGGASLDGENDEWPKQSFFVDAGGSVYRDKKLFRYIDRAIANIDASAEDSINNVRAFARPDEYERVWRDEQFNEISRHATFPRFLDLLDGLSLSWAKLNVFEPDIFC